MIRSLPIFSLLCCAAISCDASAQDAAIAEQPLHRRLDAAMHDATTPVAPRADDAEFLRRTYLNLVGVIPAVDEVRAFLGNTSPTKRRDVVDLLLNDPRHVRHLVHTFDVMLMERAPDKHVSRDQWTAWLRKSFAANKPLDQLVREILTADGSDKATRPAAKFVLDRNLDKDLLTRDIGRIFLARDLQCAQCHDHPTVPDYAQRHYYGLTAFFNRAYLFNDRKAKQTSIGEKIDGNVSFVSVFTNEKGETQPRMLDLPEIKDPPKDKQPYVAKPTSRVRGVPKYSRRLRLAEAILDSRNVAFRQNVANRVWAMMLGRGFVEPLDMWHSDNPPSHPAGVALLAQELHDCGYDLQHLLREIALTETYQRGSRLSGQSPGSPPFAAAHVTPLTPEQFAWSVLQATGRVAEIQKSVEAAERKKRPKTAENSIADPTWREQAIRTTLAAEVKQIVAVFATGAPGSFDATANQALFLRNGTQMGSWLAPRAGNLVGRLQSLKTSQEVAEEAYLSVLSRQPSASERDTVIAFVDAEKDRTAAIQQLAWALLTSAEFRLNH